MGKTVDETAAVIHVEEVGKIFTKKSPIGNVKDSVIGAGKKLAGKYKTVPDNDDDHVALNNISFDIKKGEFFGIVGRNGSGKSTLLKILAGVYQPTTGKVTISGKLTPFIELGVGFNPELNGHDNIFLNGALLGFGRAQMKSMYQDIVDFAELNDFMDVKLKNYSSGMQVRLAFSIATRCQSDILLLDEVLAVGDAVFQQKCFDYFAEIKKTGRTVCFVSHDIGVLRKYCDRGIYIRDGEVQLISSITDVIAAYEMDSSESIEAEAHKKMPSSKIISSNGIGSGSVEVFQNDKPSHAITAYKDFYLKVNLLAERDVFRANIGINILTQQGQLIHAFNTHQLDAVVNLKKGPNSITFTVENVLTDGEYTVNLAVVDQKTNYLVFQQQSSCIFKVQGIKGHKYSLIHPAVKIHQS